MIFRSMFTAARFWAWSARSGAGKSVLMRTIIGLLPRQRRQHRVFGTDQDRGERRRSSAPSQRRWGILFQQGALFSSLTARQNVQFPMREYLRLLGTAACEEVATAKLEMVGPQARRRR